MERLITYFFLVYVFTFVSCRDEETAQNIQSKSYYTCPMHPQIVRSHPGKCPICGMELVEKTTSSQVIDSSLDFILQPVNAYVLSAQPTVKTKDTLLHYTVPVNGVIDYDLQNTNTIAARVSGRIEHLYVKSNFQPVKIGDKLMDIYSKELVTAEQDYLLLLENDANNQAFLAASENKLRLLGLTDNQLKEIRKTKRPFEFITVYSHYAGHLHEMFNEAENSMETKNSAMENLREGMYVQKGQTLFRIYDTQNVWAILNSTTGQVKTGDTVSLNIRGMEDSIQGIITQEEPQYRTSQTSTTFRVKLSNAENALKIGALVAGHVIKNLRTRMVPRTAVLTLGDNTILFVRHNKFFIPVRVQTGLKIASLVQIVAGVSTNDEIARNAQMLVDSESFIKIPSHEK